MSASGPSAVFGLPAYNGESHLAEALESLLGQTRGDLSIVVVDDCSTDRTQAIAQRYAALDDRIVYERNETRRGLVGNWNRAASLARERFPGARYFAWASDHDVWHPSWLESLAAELDAHPEAVLAYPLAVRMTETGVEMPARDDTFETAGVRDPLARFRSSIRQTTWGYRVYGLARMEALEHTGPFPLVLLPDRLFLTRLALEGEFRQVKRRLWYRRYGSAESMSLRRQRRSFFPRGAPFSARLPWWLVHARALPESQLASVYLAEALRCELDASRRRLRRRRRRLARSVRASVKAHLLPAGTSLRRRPANDSKRAALAALGREDLFVSDAPGDPLVQYECMLALARAELLPAPGDVVLHFGAGLAYAMQKLFPDTTHVVVDDDASQLDGLGPVQLAVSAGPTLARHAAWLHDHGVPSVYSFAGGRPSAQLADAYWLRQLWVVPRTPRPDPRMPARLGDSVEPVHLVGRRRLV